MINRLRKLKRILAITIATVAAGLSIYTGASASNPSEVEYNRAPPKQKGFVLRNASIKKGELKQNVDFMGGVLNLLKHVEENIDGIQKLDFKEKQVAIASFGEELDRATNLINNMNPKIFNTKELKARLSQLRTALNDVQAEG